jgi:hypothetical protein
MLYRACYDPAKDGEPEPAIPAHKLFVRQVRRQVREVKYGDFRKSIDVSHGASELLKNTSYLIRSWTKLPTKERRYFLELEKLDKNRFEDQTQIYQTIST